MSSVAFRLADAEANIMVLSKQLKIFFFSVAELFQFERESLSWLSATISTSPQQKIVPRSSRILAAVEGQLLFCFLLLAGIINQESTPFGASKPLSCGETFAFVVCLGRRQDTGGQRRRGTRPCNNNSTLRNDRHHEDFRTSTHRHPSWARLRRPRHCVEKWQQQLEFSSHFSHFECHGCALPAVVRWHHRQQQQQQQRLVIVVGIVGSNIPRGKRC